MKEIRHLKTIKNKRNLNTKWLLLQNDQNADTTLLHSHDELMYCSADHFNCNSKKHYVLRIWWHKLDRCHVNYEIYG